MLVIYIGYFRVRKSGTFRICQNLIFQFFSNITLLIQLPDVKSSMKLQKLALQVFSTAFHLILRPIYRLMWVEAVCNDSAAYCVGDIVHTTRTD